MTRRLILAMAVCAPAFGQTAVPSFIVGRSSGSGPGKAWVAAEVRVGALATVKGAPFSAEETQRGVVITATGKIAMPGMPAAKVYRHSDGRTRKEYSIGSALPGMAGDAFDVVEINDPAAGIYYLLDKSKKIAHRVQYKAMVTPNDYAPMPIPMPAVGTSKSENGSLQVVTALGKREILGVEAEGRRMTVTMPGQAGSVEREMWASTKAHIVLLSTIHDPRGGEQVFEITSLKLDNPKADLFTRPRDYSVVLEQSPFTIEFGEKPANLPVPPFGMPSGSYRTGDMRGGPGQGEPAVYKIGGPVIAPVPLFRTDAGFSAAAKAAGVAGSVTLSLVVSAEGVPRDISVTKSLREDLDQKAVEDVGKWRFRAGTKDGEAVAVQAVVEFMARK